MERKPDEVIDSEKRAEAAAATPSATRRQFVVGLSGVLVGTAACDGAEGLEHADAISDPGETGGATATSGAGPTASGGTSGGDGGQVAAGGRTTPGGGASGEGGANTTATSGSSGANAAGASGGSAGASGGAPAGGSGAAGTSTAGSGGTGTAPRKQANDRVTLGATGIQVSRLAMGSGTVGSGGRSQQTRLGVAEFAKLLVHGYDQGLNFFETADAYGAHPHVAEAIRQVGRQNVVVLTKTTSENAARVEQDLERFREELGIDMIDIVLLHLKTSQNWTAQCEGAMEVLEKAKQSGAIRAHGVSCHSIEALRLAAQTPWVDIDLARVNPAGVSMDAEPATVIGVLREMKTAQKGVIGMKILGEGQLADQLDMAIRHAVDLDAIDAFTIGFTSEGQLDEVIQKIAAV